ncbi:hypothetical protein [Humidisolicoccus flavus]|uniref:hypothetical protein n=1 Tax=Humidisolicoccus flavus TaxID=3111414 RepID=UPI003252FAE8
MKTVRTRLRSFAVLAIAGATLALTGCFAPQNVDEARCSDQQINALLSMSGISLPAGVIGLANANFSPESAIEGFDPVCVAGLDVAVAGVNAKGAVAVLPGGPDALDEIFQNFDESGWAPQRIADTVSASPTNIGTIVAAPLTALVTNEESLAHFENPSELIVVVVAGG